MNYFTWAILAAVIWGVVPLFEKLGLLRVQPMVGLFYRSLGVVIGLLFLFFFRLKPQDIKAIDLRAVVLLVLSGFLASFLAQVCFYNSLKAGEVSKVVPLAGMYPLIAFILAVVFLGETMTLTKFLGVILIVAGAWVIKL